MDIEELKDRIRYIEMCKIKEEELDIILSGVICQEYIIMSDDKCICGYCVGKVGNACGMSDRAYWLFR